VKAIENGIPQMAIAEEAYRVAREEEMGERIVVGVNKFQTEGEEKRRAAHPPFGPGNPWKGRFREQER